MKINAYRSILSREGYVTVVRENGNYVCDGRKMFDRPDIISAFCRSQLEMDTWAEESVIVFALNSRFHLQGLFTASSGTVCTSIINTREIFQKLLALNAVYFIVVHNHPSGDVTPSEEDKKATEKLRSAGELIGIRLVDHIVIGNYGGYHSFKETGALK